MRRGSPLVIIVISFLACVFADNQKSDAYLRGGVFVSDNVPEPLLMSPITETVDLSGIKELEFRWSPHEGSLSDRDYYDFRLYKGYDTVETTLILKEKIPPRKYQISLKTDIFEDGQVYTWSLKQVYTGSRKSKKSYQSFKVIKR